MPGKLGTAFVRSFDSRGQLVSGDEVVGFEIIDSFVQPVVHHADGFIRAAQLKKLKRERSLALQIRPGYMHVGTGHLAAVDCALDLQICVRFEGTAGADCRYSGREVEPREAEPHFAKDGVSHGVEEMVVHSHQPGNNRVIVQIQGLEVLRNACR